MPRIQTQDYCMEDSCAIHYTNNACMSLMVINNLSIIVTYYVSYTYSRGSLRGHFDLWPIFSGNPENFDAIHVFELQPHPQPLTSSLLSRSSSKLKKKCICRGSSLQKAASSSFPFFVRSFYSSASV